MKKIWILSALVGFISISVFGLLLMPFDGSYHDMACFGSLINNAKSPCPENDPLGFANFHNNAIKKISSFTLIDNFAVLFAFVFSLLAVGLISLSSKDNHDRQCRYSYLKLLTAYYLLLAINLSWLSLHENSPSFD